ncbi:hypothetical protein LCGC14_1417080 [marine sediment metagenome]|uniref:Uncharacterized protein n=1 Tax=marine sediment metagenome TaxID=412755 RepID=A0A0F9JSZ0_9ZZZZ
MNLFKGCKDGVHKFEARYDKAPADLSAFKKLKGDDVGPVLEKLRHVTYVRDVCVLCGETVERPDATVIPLARSA